MDFQNSQLINGCQYLLKDVVRIVDPKQQKLYVKHELYPIDMYVTSDENTGDDKLVMIFSRQKSKPLYELWKNHELK